MVGPQICCYSSLGAITLWTRPPYFTLSCFTTICGYKHNADLWSHRAARAKLRASSLHLSFGYRKHNSCSCIDGCVHAYKETDGPRMSLPRQVSSASTSSGAVRIPRYPGSPFEVKINACASVPMKRGPNLDQRTCGVCEIHSATMSWSSCKAYTHAPDSHHHNYPGACDPLILYESAWELHLM